MVSCLQPLHVGPLYLTNRLVMPPMATSKAEADGQISQAVLDYYAEKSAGGFLSLILIEHSFILPEGKASPHQLSVADDRMIEGLARLAGLIHRNGSKTIMQLNHAGSATTQAITGFPPVAPSAVLNPRKGEELPRTLTTDEIHLIVQAFRAAARRVKAAGFDGVEIHSAHGYLLNQFISPLTNQRTDAYGGSLLNRIRLHWEVIAAVREEVGPDFPIFLRLGACDFQERGTTLADSQKAAREFVKAGVDVLDISGGFSGYVVPGRSGQGYFADLSEGIKKVVSIPIILTGGITEIDAAEHLLAEGKADLIGIGRALLQNSRWAEEAIHKLQQLEGV